MMRKTVDELQQKIKEAEDDLKKFQKGVVYCRYAGVDKPTWRNYKL